MKSMFLILIFFLSGCNTTMAADWAPIDETTITKLEAIELLDERTRNLLNQNFSADTSLTYVGNDAVAFNYFDNNHARPSSGNPLTNKNWFKKLRFGDEALGAGPFTMASFDLAANTEYTLEGLVLVSRATAENVTLRFGVSNLDDDNNFSFIGHHPGGSISATYATNGLVFPNLAGAATRTPMSFRGHFKTGVSTGTLDVYFTGGSGHTIRSGSYANLIAMDNIHNQ